MKSETDTQYPMQTEHALLTSVKQQPCMQCLLTAPHTQKSKKKKERKKVRHCQRCRQQQLRASGKLNKIKTEENKFNTPAPTAQSESVQLDFCRIFQMARSGMLER